VCDFFTVDLLDGTKAYVMAVIEHATRRIHILGATAYPTHERVTQQCPRTWQAPQWRP
jgi:putative transposase